jgi:hypothetical protein
MTKLVQETAVIALVAGLMAMGLALPAAQGDNSSTKATVAGRWTVRVEGSPHGAMTMGLVLRQEGKNVTGTFASPHGDMPLEGEFTDGTLTLATSGGDPQITFNAKLKDNGTLAGFLSSSMGDMTWTAERVKDSQ